MGAGTINSKICRTPAKISWTWWHTALEFCVEIGISPHTVNPRYNELKLVLRLIRHSRNEIPPYCELR